MVGFSSAADWSVLKCHYVSMLLVREWAFNIGKLLQGDFLSKKYPCLYQTEAKNWDEFIEIVKFLHFTMRKQDFCLCENRGADQLRSNCEADQRLCFCYSDRTTPLLP